MAKKVTITLNDAIACEVQAMCDKNGLPFATQCSVLINERVNEMRPQK